MLETEARNEADEVVVSCALAVLETEARKETLDDGVSKAAAESDTDAAYSPPPSVAKGS